MDSDAANAKWLEGQILATQAAIRGLLIANPHLRSGVTQELEKLTAAGLGTTLPDEVLSGIAYARKMIFPSARDMRGDQT